MTKQVLGACLVVMSLVGCAPKNQFPEDFRGSYEMSRLLGVNNVTITVDATSLTMSGCNVNCPDPVMRFTSISCEMSGGYETCTVESADCTGTVADGGGVGRALDIELRAKPGLTGEAAEHRQVNCYQHSGSISGT